MGDALPPKVNRGDRLALRIIVPLIAAIAGFVIGAGMAMQASIWMSLNESELTLITNYSILRDCKRHPCDDAIQKQLVEENDEALQRMADRKGTLSGNIISWYLGSAAFAAVFPIYAPNDERTFDAAKTPYEKLGCGLQGILCNPIDLPSLNGAGR
jgi:hypothetical protein